MLAPHAVWQGLPAISVAGQRQKYAAAFDDQRAGKLLTIRCNHAIAAIELYMENPAKDKSRGKMMAGSSI